MRWRTPIKQDARVSYIEGNLNPRNWRLHIEPPCIDLYLSLHDAPRALSAEEYEQLIELVDAWRAGEQRKHIALMRALDALDLAISLQIVRDNVDQFGEDQPNSARS